MKRSIRIATVYKRAVFDTFTPSKMSTVRWLRISECLANRGYEVDLIINTKSRCLPKHPNLRFVPFAQVDWQNYDIVKTLFHSGFQALCEEGGSEHPFIISKLGSVVGATDAVAGVHFFSQERESLYEIQQRISQKSRYVTVLTEPSRVLWEKEFGEKQNMLLVPTGVDREIPPPDKNPYKEFSEKIAVYIGNIYERNQKEVNVLWQEQLNDLGYLLRKKGIRLCFIGPGNVAKLNREVVTYLGTVENNKIWDYQYFAHVGIVLAQGQVQHNESSKIYYYLRTGLPVVSEAPVPNNSLIQEANLGFIVDHAENRLMAEAIEAAVYHNWQKEEAIRYMLLNHTWDQRADIYDALIRRRFSVETEGA